jgi:hypothetical protein
VLAIQLFLMSCSTPKTSPLYCDYATVTDSGAQAAVRSYYGKAVLTEPNSEEARQIITSLPAMLDDYILSRNGEGIEDILVMPLLFKAGQYRVQIVPFVEGGRKLMLLNLLEVSHRSKTWRRHYHTICDGGTDNCFCIVSVDVKKILLAHCNGSG